MPPSDFRLPPHLVRGLRLRASEEFSRAESDRKVRRARVLAHPDIAQRLAQPPLSYPTPEDWNGYVPPAMTPTLNGYRPNPYPQRKALIDILQAVVDREQESVEEAETL
jgi:hypothetical protein